MYNYDILSKVSSEMLGRRCMLSTINIVCRSHNGMPPFSVSYDSLRPPYLAWSCVSVHAWFTMGFIIKSHLAFVRIDTLLSGNPNHTCQSICSKYVHKILIDRLHISLNLTLIYEFCLHDSPVFAHLTMPCLESDRCPN